VNRSPDNPTRIFNPRKSTFALAALALAGAALAASLIDAASAESPSDTAMRAQVAAWGLTDPALFTEARYTRHPSQADHHSAFQDHPGALEHFPTGALISPPAHLRRQVQP
jgi:hypothetical protein